MKIYIRRSNSITWREITENVNLPITINDTVDGGYLTANLSCRFKKGFDYFDVTKPITPKWELKIVTGEENEEELVNTFYFITTDQSSVKIREEILDEEDNVKVPAIYEHKISAKERLYLLEGKFMPDYSITQPKTQFFDAYKKSASVNYLLENDFTQNGNPIYLNQGIRSVVNERNNDDNTITFNYDNQKRQHYVELKDVDKVSFDFNVEFDVAKTAPAYVKWKQGFLIIQRM